MALSSDEKGRSREPGSVRLLRFPFHRALARLGQHPLVLSMAALVLSGGVGWVVKDGQFTYWAPAALQAQPPPPTPATQLQNPRTGAVVIPPPATAAWRFAVSGDSRNCGDIVMPAIARRIRGSGSSFYWHLGDFRTIYAVDEDISAPALLQLGNQPPALSEYQKQAWGDFIRHQIEPFGNLPVFLVMGNHEAIAPKTRQEFVATFNRWLGNTNQTYYHWKVRNVDFIALDTATIDQFDAKQMNWLRGVLAADEASHQIQTLVVGMHEALPGSVSRSHSMSESPVGDQTGREIYEALWQVQASAHKHVYVLASHSHFYLDHIFKTPDWKGRELPGWIVGTAGAVRYKLPPEATPDQHPQTNVYGYLLATVVADGTVSFEFHPLDLATLLKVDRPAYAEQLVQWCYENNRQ